MKLVNAVLLAALCLQSAGCFPDTQPQPYDYSQVPPAAEPQDDQSALIFLQAAANILSAFSGQTPAPTPVYSPRPVVRATYVPPKNTAHCSVSHNSCWNACHPATFGYGYDQYALKQCEANCDVEYNSCLNR